MNFTDREAASAVQSRSNELLAISRRDIHESTDRVFTWLMPFQFVAGVVAALVISPRTWVGTASAPHIHVWAAVVVGGLISGVPVWFTVFRRGENLTRHIVAIGQMLTSALLIHLSGGRIETHFHVFGSLAFLAFYRDWKVLVTATIVVAGDHWFRGAYFPQSVYGVLAATSWRWLEHAGWVIFEDVILMLSCAVGMREMRKLADKRAELEQANAEIEARVARRTEELSASESRARRTAETLEMVNEELKEKQEEYVRLNKALEEASKAAADASAVKSAFLANMSHEIRTPMTAILGFAEILKQHQDNPSDRINAANVIERNGQHLMAIINDILDLSKIEAGRMEVERTDCDVEELLKDVESLFQFRARDKGIEFAIRLAAPIPRNIKSDPVRLKQAIVNLVGNAIKFTRAGSVVLEVAGEKSEQRLVFRVVDTGPGLTPEECDRLFQPFTQSDVTTTRKFGGTGLGLAITRSLSELLGGHVTVQSTPGRGSTFTLTVATGSTDLVSWISAVGRSSESVMVQPASRIVIDPPARILLVEDGPDNQRLVAHILRSAGAVVTIASNGQEGVDAAWEAFESETPFDLILMDMQMPIMDGYSATRLLRSRGYTRPIVALTAHAMKGEIERTAQAGCDAHLPKPTPRDLLICEVIRYIAREVPSAMNA